jgi:2-C-methyl-D-erythritol 4-phosphate cytidylyltransferase/2-C-methyl-D-erythritol 2,4-cyclodiphosphate synthase
MQTQEFHTIIVAAGVGNRMGTDLPKCYLNIGGQSVLARTVAVFDGITSCASITVVIHKDHGDLARVALTNFPHVKFVIGGDTRQDSVRMGLNALAHLSDNDIILIHDGARPFVARDVVLQLVSKISEMGAASIGIPVVDSLRHAPENNVIESIVSRDKVFAMQTPQGFRAGIIRAAHNQKINATDDAELVMHAGHDVHIVQGDRSNFKITTKDDLAMAELMMNAMMATKIKTGMGYDVHAFDDMPATHIRMGGIDIPYARKLKGHSDADVVLHAITDAIYGAIGSGDIGFHFPPSKAEHKNQDSADFLKHAVELLRNKNGTISNIDCVIICEEPKITPHREKMRARIAEICSIIVDDVAVKATTSEQLGFTGRKEGIACQAIVTIEMPRV